MAPKCPEPLAVGFIVGDFERGRISVGDQVTHLAHLHTDGFFLAIQPLLLSMSFLGSTRNVIPGAALDAVGDMPRYGLDVSAGMGVAVLAAWVAASVGAGAWRTRTREI